MPVEAYRDDLSVLDQQAFAPESKISGLQRLVRFNPRRIAEDIIRGAKDVAKTIGRAFIAGAMFLTLGPQTAEAQYPYGSQPPMLVDAVQPNPAFIYRRIVPIQCWQDYYGGCYRIVGASEEVIINSGVTIGRIANPDGTFTAITVPYSIPIVRGVYDSPIPYDPRPPQAPPNFVPFR